MVLNKSIKINWKQFEKDIKLLADQIPNKAFTKIIAITRGGMIPAYYLARYLGIRNIRTICMLSYTKDNEQEALRVLPSNQKVDDSENCLIVDDLIDSGKTLEMARKYYPNSKIAVLYRKPHSPNMVNYHVCQKDGWIIFPWEE
jgi:xanthine phosphoribosyltransferase